MRPDLLRSLRNDGFGALCVALARHRPQLLSDSHLAQQGALENFRNNDLDPADLRLLNSLQEPDGKTDLLLVKIPKRLAFLEDQLYRIRPHLHARAQILGAGMVKEFGDNPGRSILSLGIANVVKGGAKSRKEAVMIITTPKVVRQAKWKL